MSDLGAATWTKRRGGEDIARSGIGVSIGCRPRCRRSALVTGLRTASWSPARPMEDVAWDEHSEAEATDFGAQCIAVLHQSRVAQWFNALASRVAQRKASIMAPSVLCCRVCLRSCGSTTEFEACGESCEIFWRRVGCRGRTPRGFSVKGAAIVADDTQLKITRSIRSTHPDPEMQRISLH